MPGKGEEDATGTGDGKPLGSSGTRAVDGEELKKAKDDDKDDGDLADGDSSACRGLPGGKFKVVGLLISILVIAHMSI